MKKLDVLIVGAGPSGLATAFFLKNMGYEFEILEKGLSAGHSYKSMHDSLRLLTPSVYSNLPGMKLGRNPLTYYSKDELVSYYDRYSKHFELPLKTEVLVESVSAEDNCFMVQTNKGTKCAKAIVAATGVFSFPFRPNVPGLAESSIPVMHSSEYRNASNLKGMKRILVVGAGNTGTEIAMDLANSGYHVWLSSKNRPTIFPHRLLGIDVHFISRPLELLTRFFARFRKKPFDVSRTPVLGRKIMRRIKIGEVHLLGALRKWDGDTGYFPKEHQSFDAVILATGYRYETPYLEGLVDDRGVFYMGKPGEFGVDSGFLRGIKADARRISKRIKTYLA